MFRILLIIFLIIVVGLAVGYVGDKLSKRAKTISRSGISRTGRLVVFLEKNPQGAVVTLVMVALIVWGFVQVLSAAPTP